MATVELTRDTFHQTVQGNALVIVDFWAPWCGPCKSFAPVYEKASGEHPDVVFGKVNTEEEQELAAEFGIRSIPTIMVFREQIGVFSQPGALPPAMLQDVIVKTKELDMDWVRAEIAKHEQEHAHEHGGGCCGHDHG
jgi:thioredoxin 1